MTSTTTTSSSITLFDLGPEVERVDQTLGERLGRLRLLLDRHVGSMVSTVLPCCCVVPRAAARAPR